MKRIHLGIVVTFLLFLSTASLSQSDSFQVLEGFKQNQGEKSEIVKIETKKKHWIMFLMGIPLLLLIGTTVALGIAMVVYEKPVFVAHMVCAGLSLTLALAHAIVGLVWFNPF